MDELVSRESVKLGDGWAEGLRLAFPVVVGYIPVGFAFGVLAQKFGLSTFNALAMSVLVYAGSSQYIAIGLLAASAPWLSVVFTTFVVNLRMMLMSAALSPFLHGWSKPELALFAQQLTDETFAVHATQLRLPRPKSGRFSPSTWPRRHPGCWGPGSACWVDSSCPMWSSSAWITHCRRCSSRCC